MYTYFGPLFSKKVLRKECTTDYNIIEYYLEILLFYTFTLIEILQQKVIWG